MLKRMMGGRRCLCTLLAALLAVSSLLPLTSCGDTKENIEETSASVESLTEAGTVVETEGPHSTLDIPEDISFGGRVFRVMSIKFNTQYTMLDVEKITSEPVNDAIYERNRLIEDKFDMKFQCQGDDWQKNLGHLSKQVHAGYREGESYDLIMLIDREAFSAAMSNLLYPYSKLEYVDVDKDYYFKNINEKYRFGNHTFFAFGRDSINVLGFSAGLLYNKELANDQQLPNLYETVRNQEWTYDTFFTYCEDAVKDLNGDSKHEIGTDRLGLVGHFDDTIPCFWISAGECIVEKDADNMPACNMEGNERFIDVMQSSLRHLDLDAYDVYSTTTDIDGAFMNDMSLFYSDSIRHLATIRAMETDYGLLPWPKFNADQENYITRSYAAWPHCVPTTCQDPEMTSIIMQALAYYSRDKVYDAYYEQALSTRYLRDSDSVEMLQLMMDTLEVDLGDTIWLDDVGRPITNQMIRDGANTGFTSMLMKLQRTTDLKINRVTEFIEAQASE